jgi:hypothetical protein
MHGELATAVVDRFIALALLSWLDTSFWWLPDTSFQWFLDRLASFFFFFFERPGD